LAYCLLPTAGEVSLDLIVKKTPGNIYNPTTGTYDNVYLRSYHGGLTRPDDLFVAPTITIVPGDTVRLNLSNRLSADDPSCTDNVDVNTPHCFNSTNLHSHGLWISPSGNSDNVLIKVDPEVDFSYEWNIPLDHPAGTFWYHPHLHGSTALQVASGMGGALIIKGDRLPEPQKNGDIDTLLRDSDGEPYSERLAVFQQIQYACRTSAGDIRVKDGKWVCNTQDVGTIENYDQFGPSSWAASGRYTTINGHVMPTFQAKVGEIERWRMVHAGVHETIKPSFRKASNSAAADTMSASGFAAASSKEKSNFIDAMCSGVQATQLSLAMDGLTRNRLVEQTQSTLQPGYREDLLMVFPETGVYCIIDEPATDGTVSGGIETRKILGFVRVTAGTVGSGDIADVVDYVKGSLITSAENFMSPNMRETIVANLQKDLGLENFVDHKSIQDAEVTGYQSLAFNISNGTATRFEVGELSYNGEPINLHPYAPDRVDRDLVLGGVDEWSLKSFSNKGIDNQGGHPYHIHVNPFQIIRILDALGNDVSGHDADNTSQYAGLKGTWKDTIFVDGHHTIITRTRYQRYIGEFVLHCHILDHEDKGMMQNVRISVPNSAGQPTSAHGMSH